MRKQLDSVQITDISLCLSVAQRSKCHRRYVGCVIRYIDGGMVTGRNGHPRNTAEDDRCLRSEIGVASNTGVEMGFCTHAEENALLFCDFSRMKGSEVFISDHPCPKCLKALMQCGASAVYYYGSLEELSLLMIKRLKPKVEFWSIDSSMKPDLGMWVTSETQRAFVLTVDEEERILESARRSAFAAKTANTSTS